MNKEQPKWFCGNASEWKLIDKALRLASAEKKLYEMSANNDVDEALERAMKAGAWTVPVGGVVGGVAGGLAKGLSGGAAGIAVGALGMPFAVGFAVLIGGMLLTMGLAAGERVAESLRARATRDAALALGTQRAGEIRSATRMARDELWSMSGATRDELDALYKVEMITADAEELATEIEQANPESMAKRRAEREARALELAERVRRRNPEAFANGEDESEPVLRAASLEGRIEALGPTGEEGVAAAALARVALKWEKEDGPERRELARMIEQDLPKLLEAWERVPAEARERYDDVLGCTPRESLARGFGAALARVSEIRGGQARRAALSTETEAKVLESRVAGIKA